MREIKFRGWHTVASKMFSAEEMAADQLTILPTGSFINVHGLDTRLSEIYDKSKFIPLQYTGLKDKNGVEIYEGDIVRNELYEVFLVEYWGEHWFGYVIRTGETWCGHLYEYDEYEVIGNIYDNPEMLEVS